MQRQIAKELLSIGAVFLRPEEPFTWASGIQSPIYCDNRLTLSAPAVREKVEAGLAALVREHFPQCEALMGTSTAGIGETIVKYAQNAREAGLDGVVCSPLEAAMVKHSCSPQFLTVTPGIRFADASKDDQVRITTPARAREIGSDYIVVGRPVTAAPDPVAAYERCLKEFLNQ